MAISLVMFFGAFRPSNILSASASASCNGGIWIYRGSSNYRPRILKSRLKSIKVQSEVGLSFEPGPLST